MTCIVGLIHDNSVYIGTDSCVSFGHEYRIMPEPKVFRNGEFVIAASGSCRLLQILQYSFKPPAIGDIPIEEYMVTSFISALRSCFKDCGFSKKSEEKEEFEGYYMVGVRNNLYVGWNDYQIGKASTEYESIGNGSQYAMGSMWSTKKYKDPIKRINVALAASEAFVAGIKGPFVIMSTL